MNGAVSSRSTGTECVLVSACLLGVCCRFDGKAKLSSEVARLAETCCLVPICPEQLGGLPTPRSPAQISSGSGGDVLDGGARVLADDGSDVTGAYIRGAQEALRVGKILGAERAILTDKSPACGVNLVYNNRVLVDGCGVTTALLIREGIAVEAAS